MEEAAAEDHGAEREPAPAELFFQAQLGRGESVSHATEGSGETTSGDAAKGFD